MGLACKRVMTVYNKQGVEVESKLHEGLLSIAPTRRVANGLYSKIQQLSKNKDWLDNQELDINGEVTINSLLKIPSFIDRLDKEKLIYKLDKQIGRFNKNGEIKKYLNYNDVVDIQKDFLNNNPLKETYTVAIETMTDNESNRVFYSPKVRLRGDNINYSIDTKNSILNESLNRRLETILEKNGVSIGHLTELENKLGISGITDFSKTREVAEGLVELIRLAHGEKGRKALPEEFAHFAIEAMGDNVFKTRLINYVKDNNLAKDIIDNYDIYYDKYEGNVNKLAEEAVGKLVAQSLLKQQELDNRYKGIQGILNKFIDNLKSWIKNTFNAKEINEAISLAEQDADSIAKNILTESIPLDIKNIATSERYLSTVEKVNRDREILLKIRDTEFKRLELYRKQTENVTVTLEQQEVLDSIQQALSTGEELEGLYSFLQTALTNLKIQNENLLNIKDYGTSNIKESAQKLRSIRDFIYSYKSSIALIKEENVDNKSKNNRYEERFTLLLGEVTLLIDELDILYTTASVPVFSKFISEFIPQESLNNFKDDNGKPYTVEDLIIKSNRDLTLFDRWLGAMADSSDPIIQAYDQIVKKAKNKARRKDINLTKEIIKEQKLLEEAGIKDTSWMFVKDVNGNITGKYLTEIDWDKYKQARTNMYLEVKKLYGESPVGNDITKANLHIRAWYKSNKEDGLPKLSIYKSEAFSKLNAAQLRYYNFFTKTLSDLNEALPVQDNTDIIWIRKDLLERMKSSKNLKEVTKHLGKSIEEGVVSKEDDTHYGKRSSLKDFEGNEVDNLPIYYRTKFDTSEVSLDTSSALIMYSAMANEYAQMKEVVDILEVGRTLLREREITKVYKGNTLAEIFKYRGSIISSPITTKGDATKTMAKLNDLMSMQVYNKLMPDDSSITILGKELSTTKLASQLTGMTSLVNMSFNVLGGLANVTMGSTQMFIEAIGSEYFGVKDMLKADSIYSKHITGVMAESGVRTPTNKLSLFMEYFNVLQDHEQDIKSHDLDKKNRFARLFKRDLFYFTYKAGEHYMQTRTALALSNQYKLVDSRGNKVSLFDAMEVVYIDPNKKSLGATIRVKDGYTKEDGSLFTDADAYAFERKVYRINRKLHGTYNKADKNAIQKFALGRLAIMFRKWMPDYLERRYGKKKFDVELNQETEGYYRTLGRVLWNIRKNALEHKVLFQSNTLTKHEKANLKRAISEMAIFLSVFLSMKGIDKLFDDDKDSWLLNTLEYQLQRLYTEIGFGIPSPTMISEGFTILKSPSATIKTLENIANLTKLANPFSYMEDVESGRYKGESEAYKALMQSPVGFPVRAIYRTLEPEEATKFYKN